jgi:solute carrier family 25 (adenine nucleotide translocator) protein 4/5/6/31
MSTGIEKKAPKQSNFIIDFVLAGASAAVGKTATAPLERVKLILQTQQNLEIVGGKYVSMRDCFNRLVKAEGLFSLWRGNLPNVMRYFPNQALNFAFKDSFKEIFCRYDPKKNFWKYFFGSCLSGGLAGSLSLILLHPIDLARTRLATDNKDINGNRRFKGTGDCLSQIFKSEGTIGIYRGIMVSIASIFTYRAAYFGGYDTMKSLLSPETWIIVKWTLTQLILLFAAIFYYPLDTIRRRIMVETGKKYEDKKYKSAMDCFYITLQKEKVAGFYKGFVTNAIRTSGSSIVLILYDEFQRLLGLEARGGSKE